MRSRAWIAALAIGASTVGACSGGDAPTRQLTVIGSEMKFEAPDQAVPGDYDITFRNVGAEYHELAVTDASGRVLARRSIAGGQQVIMPVSLAPGTYELGCFEPGHYEAGMYKTLVVDKR
jgi:plastocyanin